MASVCVYGERFVIDVSILCEIVVAKLDLVRSLGSIFVFMVFKSYLDVGVLCSFISIKGKFKM